MSEPKVTRLRFVSSKDPRGIQEFLDALGVRVQIYGAPQWNGKRWYLWFVPSDIGKDIASTDL